ncbi:hypothetical protein GRF59_14380 [Paenibacillus sp. HJL G12]|uniref:Uncharacterized protein n=1 Tax=Paenibacillus dendrobii TaxID=2691084 RepID=A0A7X3IIW7_9BACL|nr:hypothetical protein [Paenibacillus dendrobii]MWV44804.1 hypothetical protein [Paenibacillus dendrobii]
MNNQNDLISKNKLLAWLEEQFREYPEEKMGDYGEGQHSFDKVATAVEYGVFDPDPIPLPTLKPDDRVRHPVHGFGTATTGKIMSDGQITVQFDNYVYLTTECVRDLELLIKEGPEDVR